MASPRFELDHNPALLSETELNTDVTLIQDADFKKLAKATGGHYVPHDRGETVLWDLQGIFEARLVREIHPKTKQKRHHLDSRIMYGDITGLGLVTGENFAAIVTATPGVILGIRILDGKFSTITGDESTYPQSYSNARDKAIAALPTSSHS